MRRCRTDDRREAASACPVHPPSSIRRLALPWFATGVFSFNPSFVNRSKQNLSALTSMDLLGLDSLAKFHAAHLIPYGVFSLFLTGAARWWFFTGPHTWACDANWSGYWPLCHLRPCIKASHPAGLLPAGAVWRFVSPRRRLANHGCSRVASKLSLRCTGCCWR